MKHILLIFFLLAVSVNFTGLKAQTYTTESKSCGSCGKAVSNNSRIGMTCPHCHVRWGYENETKTTNYKNSSGYKLPNSKSSKAKTYPLPGGSYNDFTIKAGMTATTANLRTGPSTKSSIITKMPSFTSFDIIKKVGAWYYIEFINMDWDTYKSRKIRGYLHQSVIQ